MRTEYTATDTEKKQMLKLLKRYCGICQVMNSLKACAIS